MAKTLREAILINGKIVAPGQEDALTAEEVKSLTARGFFDPKQPTTQDQARTAGLSRSIDMSEEAQKAAATVSQPERDAVAEATAEAARVAAEEAAKRASEPPAPGT